MVQAADKALAATFVLHTIIGAGSVHFLARPHVFSILFLRVAFALLWADRLHPSHHRWWLVPLTARWVNLHGGFAGLPITLGVG